MNSSNGVNRGASGSGGGASTLSILGIVFVVLKLTDVINWSWWWVLLPFWGPLVFGLAVVAIYILVRRRSPL